MGFLVALHQNKELLGTKGLLPIPLYLSKLRTYFKVAGNSTTNFEAFNSAPSLFWFVGDSSLDVALDVVAYCGLVLSAILLVLGAGNAIIFAALWALYHSIVNVGQRWYSFGWESQLLETGFLAIFMSPLLSLRQFPLHTPPSWVVVWGNRWLMFRIMLGAGLIKIRGDQCWRDLTCMNYHYETQPVPNPLSYFLHQSPQLLHKAETLGNHFVELAVPFFIFLPRPFRISCGLLQIFFQVVLILSGNLSFLNWLTILPSIYCLDDRFLSRLFPTTSRSQARAVQLQQESAETKRPFGYYVRKVSSVCLAVLLGYLSIPVVQNLLSSRQMMNTSFDSLRIVNTYGAFGSITKERTEVVFEGTLNSTLGQEGAWQWEEFEFKCKPGALARRPCVISPYHYRLDWLMWFAAFQSYQHNPWLVHLAGKLLAGDPSVNSLIQHNPFHHQPPKYIRALHYRYEYTKIGSKEAGRGHWWKRKLIGQYLPPLSAKQVKPVLREQGWKWYTRHQA